MATDELGEDTQVITLVCEGLHAVDVDGRKVGTVKEVRLGDPGAVTDDAQELGIGDDDGPPASAAHWLRRTGYVRLHQGLLGGDTWASADDLASVDDDAVLHLAVDEKHLVR